MRKTIPAQVQLQVWKRDNWICKYCGDPVFFAPTLKLLNELSPGHGYYHPSGKEGSILPLFQWKWASVDHIKPVSKGGDNAIDNYVTACWECNLKYTDSLDKPASNVNNKKAIAVNWDGLSSLYPKLCKNKDKWVKLLVP